MLLPAFVTLFFGSAGNGTISLADLCTQLTGSTGEKHYVDGIFTDHNLYFRVKDPSPERLRNLTAKCLVGEWKQDGKQWILKPGKMPEMPDWFPAAWAKAYDPQGKHPAEVPDPKAVYFMRVGDKVTSNGSVVHRLMGSIYERGDQWVVSNPLTEIRAGLGPRAATLIKIPESFKPKPRMGGSSISAGDGKWSKSTPDPIAARVGALMDVVSKSLEGDFAAAIPDGLVTSAFFINRDLPLGDTLAALADGLDWTVDGTTLIGSLTAADAGARTQASRSALINWSNPLPEFFDTPTLGKFEAQQPPLAVIAYHDILALMMGGASLDGTPHYPWDVRLYATFTDDDWQVLRTQKATIGDLSPKSQEAIRKLLLKTRSGSGTIVEPFLPTPVTLRETTDEPIIVYYGDRTPELMDTLNVASHRNWSGYKEASAKFLPVKRRILTLQIGGVEGNSVIFTKVEMPADKTRLTFVNLPKSIRDQIAKHQTDMKNQDNGRVIPPVF